MTLTAPTAPAPTVPPNPARGLVCRNCGATFGLIAEHACAECFGPLEVDYDRDLMRAVTREQIEAGPRGTLRFSGALPQGAGPHGPGSDGAAEPGARPGVPQLRRHLRPHRRARLRGVLRPARGRLRPRPDAGGDAGADRGGSAEHLALLGAAPRGSGPGRPRHS